MNIYSTLGFLSRIVGDKMGVFDEKIGVDI
jgi:hypothetical protein